MIYLDNAATTLKKPQETIDAVIGAMQTLGNAGRGVNDASLHASRNLYLLREKLVQFFHGENATRICFTSNSTEALNIAIRGIVQPGDHVITTVLEHNSVLRPLYEMEEAGAELTIVGCDEKGYPLYEEMEKAIRPNTKAMVVTHASNLTGNVVDIERVGAICEKHKILFLVDASQTAGILPIDVEKMHIDVLCFTGHKSLLGPQGTGGLYVKEGVTIRPLKSGGSGIKTFDKKHPVDMPTALEAGTLNGHGLAGLQASIDYINRVGMDAIREKEMELMHHFLEGIEGISGLVLYGDPYAKEHCPVVAWNLLDYSSDMVGDSLYEDYEICVRTGGHCAPLMHEALGTKDQGAVRVSFSHFNTMEEVDEIILAIHEMAE
ncbi:MAG: aminotransferase class V-fold PLP-dependent enzyme [Eubacteriales bacterium]|nr:aminotransferase class V-fold PLP-dependent enzyme [Eubacteriales bacterium]